MNTFRDAARQKEFVLSAELFLRPESTAEMLALQCRELQPYVDGVLVTDNQGGQLHMSPLAAASIVLANGVDPVVQLACRNRNRIALLAELLGAAALGVSSLLLIRGNRVPEGFEPRPKAVFDVDAAELISMASKIKSDEHLPGLPDLFVGSVITPHQPKSGWVPEKVTTKANAGAQFVQSHICMDPKLLQDYMQYLVSAGIPRLLSVHITLAVMSSADDARWLAQSRPNNRIPAALIKRLADAKDPEAEGVRIAAEQLQALAKIPGISGAHLIATRNLGTIPAAIEMAGIRKS
tara:strand:- start:55 stop:936 length:882 start_codon:yes stop_codon:yes gene_type:complete